MAQRTLRSTTLSITAVIILCGVLPWLLTSWVSAFVAPRLQPRHARHESHHAAETSTAVVDTVEADTKATSYVAMNRFMVRDGSGPAFEQRWAQRKSSLKTLDGFQWFGLLRRVQSPDPEDEYTYSSFTWWETKKNFNSWRKGPAFKEAHGGGDIFSFLGMIINGFLTSKGPPKPCFWRGDVLVPDSAPAVKYDGGPGSKPEFGGEKVMDPEVFVSLRRYKDDRVKAELEENSRQLLGTEGFRFAHVLSRDQEADDGAGAALLTVWNSRKHYEASSLRRAAEPSRGEALYEGILVLEN